MSELPANLTAERTVLGCVLMGDPVLKVEASESLKPEDFSLEAHQHIYRAMLTLCEDGTPLDPVTVEEELVRTGKLQVIGGLAYLTELILNTMQRKSIASYIQLILEKSTRRKLITAAQRIIAEAMTSTENTDNLIERAECEISELAVQTAGPSSELFVPWSRFRKHGSGAVNWLVDGAVEEGTNGFIVGLPKAAKSLAAAALAVSLVSGRPWLGMAVKRRRVAIASREDYAGTTSRRIEQLLLGMDIDPESPWLDEMLYINSRCESQHMMLTDLKTLKNLIQNLKARKTEVLFLDVLKVLHDSDENDSREMGLVLKRVSQIQSEVGCQVFIIHHARKDWDDGMTLSEVTRGSSAIAGFAEFIIAMRLVNEEEAIRRIKFDTKADQASAPFYWKIKKYEPTRSITVERVPYEPVRRSKKLDWGAA